MLTYHRGAARLTQEELAERARLSVEAVSALERGRRTAPRPPTVSRLAAALRLGPAEREAFSAAARRGSRSALARRPPTPDLRIPGTTFVGREHEVAAVRSLLRRADVRLVTVTGPPGVGKTRLGLEAATAARGDYRDGVAFVPLASLAIPGQVMPAIRQALGLAEARDWHPLETVAAHCQHRRLLLFLDNLEHLLPAAEELAALLDRCPELRILATSRVASRVSAEHELTLGPLDPAPASALFAERAAAARPSFRLTAATASTVTLICERLDRLPLALELAASWLRLLSPADVLDQLDRRLDLLVRGPRDLPERQRTMRATLAWSCELLPAESKALLRRLAVFRGGAPLDALDGVCQRAGRLGGGVLPHLSVLADHSLVARDEPAGGEARVTLLETVREYAAELLEAAGEEEATALAHLDHCADMAARARQEMRAGARASWLQLPRRELDNVRAALSWATCHGRADAGLRLAAALRYFWDYGGHRREGLTWLDRLLAAGSQKDSVVRATALQVAGMLSWRLGELERSVANHRESLAIFRELGDRHGAAETLRDFGNAVGSRGDVHAAIALFEEAIVTLRELDDRWLLAATLNSLAIHVSRTGDRRRANSLYGDALGICRELDHQFGIAFCLTNLGKEARLAGDLRLARSLLDEAVAIARQLEAPYHLWSTVANLGDLSRDRCQLEAALEQYREGLSAAAGIGDPEGVARCLRGLAWGAWAEGRSAPAARLYGAAQALCPVAVGHDSHDEALHRMVLEALRERLGPNVFAAAYEAGGRLPFDGAVAEAAAAASWSERRPPAS